MTSTTAVVVIRPSSTEKQRILPNYISLMKMENITLGVTWIFSYELRNIDVHTEVIWNIISEQWSTKYNFE